MTSKVDDIKDLIEKSGNSFHAKVVNKLRELGWSVLVSPHYSDNFSDKPREMDIVAEKRFEVDEFMNNWLGTVKVRLFVECKYISGNTVFWFDSKDTQRAIERVMNDTGLEDPRRNNSILQHHYLAEVPVAKLFASEKSRTEENELMNKAINQVLNATIYYRDRSDLKIALAKSGHVDKVIKHISYPLIVVNSFDNVFRTEMSGIGDPTEIVDPFPLEVNYAYIDKNRNGVNEYFLIDVVNFGKIEQFLSTAVEKIDVGIVSEKLRWDSHSKSRA